MHEMERALAELNTDKKETSRETRRRMFNERTDNEFLKGSFDTKFKTTVTVRTNGVFRLLCYTPSASRTDVAEVTWGEVLHATAVMGFRAEKIYGPAWYFDPVKPDIEQGILFHEPHPDGVDGKITLRNAMVTGMRLRHVFGWCGDTCL